MKFVKICPVCGKHNEPSAIECVESFTDISMVPVTREDEPISTSKPPVLKLIAPDNLTLTIDDGVTIGREGIGNEIFKNHLTISRRHAKFQYFIDENIWKISDEGSKNGTFIDGKKIEPDSWNNIKNGSEISLSSRFKLTTTLNNE